LDAFARLTINDLIKFKGVGEVKAITLQVAFEIARRRKVAENSIEFIKTSEDVFKIFGPKLRDLSVEQFHIILLNRKNGILSMQKISEGGTTGTVVDAKVVFKKAFDHLATAMILVHNHPSGNKMPSSADLEITKKIKSFGELIEMTILDHIIIANDNYFSFADENVL
jgi:DNA repair protein RadC